MTQKMIYKNINEYKVNTYKKRIFVVAKNNDEFEKIKDFDDVYPGLHDIWVLGADVSRIQGLRYYEGDRFVVGHIDDDDIRLEYINRSLVKTGFWVKVLPFSDVVLTKPKSYEKDNDGPREGKT